MQLQCSYLTLNKMNKVLFYLIVIFVFTHCHNDNYNELGNVSNYCIEDDVVYYYNNEKTLISYNLMNDSILWKCSLSYKPQDVLDPGAYKTMFTLGNSIVILGDDNSMNFHSRIDGSFLSLLDENGLSLKEINLFNILLHNNKLYCSIGSNITNNAIISIDEFGKIDTIAQDHVYHETKLFHSNNRLFYFTYANVEEAMKEKEVVDIQLNVFDLEKEKIDNSFKITTAFTNADNTMLCDNSILVANLYNTYYKSYSLKSNELRWKVDLGDLFNYFSLYYNKDYVISYKDGKLLFIDNEKGDLNIFNNVPKPLRIVPFNLKYYLVIDNAIENGELSDKIIVINPMNSEVRNIDLNNRDLIGAELFKDNLLIISKTGLEIISLKK